MAQMRFMGETSVDCRRPGSNCSLWCGGVCKLQTELRTTTRALCQEDLNRSLKRLNKGAAPSFLLVRTDSHSSIRLSSSHSSNQRRVSVTPRPETTKLSPNSKLVRPHFVLHGTPQIITNVQSLPLLTSLSFTRASSPLSRSEDK